MVYCRILFDWLNDQEIMQARSMRSHSKLFSVVLVYQTAMTMAVRGRSWTDRYPGPFHRPPEIPNHILSAFHLVQQLKIALR